MLSRSAVFIECTVEAKTEDIRLIFEPCENPQWLDGPDFCDTLISVKARSIPKITVSSQNSTNHDYYQQEPLLVLCSQWGLFIPPTS